MADHRSAAMLPCASASISIAPSRHNYNAQVVNICSDWAGSDKEDAHAQPAVVAGYNTLAKDVLLSCHSTTEVSV